MYFFPGLFYWQFFTPELLYFFPFTPGVAFLQMSFFTQGTLYPKIYFFTNLFFLQMSFFTERTSSLVFFTGRFFYT
jgi:hypothetical protein